MIKVLIVGQTPPPHHGQSIVVERLVRATYRDVRVFHVRMNFSKDIASVGRLQAGKLWELIRVIARIIWVRMRHQVRILYYPPAGPFRVPLYRDLAILIATRWLFDKTVFHFHACGVGQLRSQSSWLVRRLCDVAYGHADAAVRSSLLLPNDGAALGAKRDVIVPLGVDDHAADMLRRRPDGAPCLLFVGILSEDKGLFVLLDACRRLADRGLPFRARLIGAFPDPATERRAAAAIDEGDLAAIVERTGVLTGDAKWRAYADADVLCFPTFHPSETFGLVLIEAMSFGLPVVATRWRAVPSIVDDGQTGLLVEPQDAAELADRLERLLRDSELRRRMGALAREKYVREYTEERFVERMERAFEEVAA